MDKPRKPLVWLHGEVKTPPFTRAARLEAGTLLRRLPRPMPPIGPRCHELRIRDEKRNGRILYRTDPDTIVINDGRRRSWLYDDAARKVQKGGRPP